MVRFFRWLAFAISLLATPVISGQPPTVKFVQEDGRLRIFAGDQPLATYVYDDDKIPRPYFAHVRTPQGNQVTRNHPPIEGEDATDHATFHPGVWMTFGDLSGHDYWRLKAKTEFVRFVERPQGGKGDGSYTVQLRYQPAKSQDSEQTVCQEVCRYQVVAHHDRWMLIWDSRFSSDEHDFVFGDQEEMGLGVRVATPISVRKGGRILNADGKINEKQVWGNPALWCDYSGVIDGRRVGVLLAPALENFRSCWFHARDYGFVAANPFGRNAFTKSEKSRVVVKKGETFRLRYGLLFYAGKDDQPLDCESFYREMLTRMRSEL